MKEKIILKEDLKGFQQIFFQNKLIAIILKNNFNSNKVTFFTPESFSQQLGYLPHKVGDVIKAHIHKPVDRQIFHTHEVLFIKKGEVKVNFYSDQKDYIGSKILEEGDVILLCGGGHGFEFLKDSIMIEVKQGPYIGVDDKERFEGIEGKNDTSK